MEKTTKMIWRILVLRARVFSWFSIDLIGLTFLDFLFAISYLIPTRFWRAVAIALSSS